MEMINTVRMKQASYLSRKQFVNGIARRLSMKFCGRGFADRLRRRRSLSANACARVIKA
jgi:hypothetical protein